jgi:type IV secretion system protein VirD4
MLDEFPALGRLDFFESALAFMAGYGLKAFLIAQSLNQIEKAYGQHNAILDNCHVRVAFATNDNETAKRVSESLGTATEMRAMKNYAGHRLSPWLGHLMVSRSETSRPLLTQGEILQLPETDEVVMIGGTPPIRAKKAQYYIDRRMMKRILPPPDPKALAAEDPSPDDWTGLAMPGQIEAEQPEGSDDSADEATDPANAGIRREPELPQHEDIIPQPPTPQNEFQFDRDDTADDEATRNQRIQDRMRGASRQASLDPGDGIAL